MRRRVLLLMVAVYCCFASAQNPLTAFPKNYKQVLENDQVSVIRVHYGPHEQVGVHDHSAFPTIYVYLNDSGPVRFDHDEKPAFSLTRPPTVTGAFRVSPGRVERHSVTNLSEKSSDYLRVELKQMPLGSGLHEFRGKAPEKPLSTGTTVEFDAPQIAIERIICAGTSPCSVPASSSPSLLIGFSALKVTEGNGSHSEMQVGDIRWMPASQRLSIAEASSEPAHLLRIVFRAAQQPATGK